MSTPTYNKIISALDAHGCKYETQHHEPTLTSEIAARVRGVSLHEGAKAIVTKGDKTGANYLFVMPADMKLWGEQSQAGMRRVGRIRTESPRGDRLRAR